jgi:hypothetical protein
MDKKPDSPKYVSTHQVELLTQTELDQEIEQVGTYIKLMTSFIQRNYSTDLRTMPTDQALEFIEKERSGLEAEVAKAEKYLAMLKKRRGI